MSAPPDRLDWAAIHAQVNELGRLLDEQPTTDPVQATTLLEDRARGLARPAQPGSPGATLALLCITLAGERYALEMRLVEGVFRLIDLAPLPGADATTLGVTAWRGQLLRILDLRQLLGLSATGLDDRVWVVVLRDGARSVGLLAGAITGTLDVPEEALRPPDSLADRRRDFIRGVTPEAILILDAAALARPQTRRS